MNNDLYYYLFQNNYLYHGGPGSGRYPLGSGERPYQMFEGRGGGPRRFSLRSRSSGVSKPKPKTKRELERERKEREQAQEEKRIHDLEKADVLKRGSAADVLRYQGELTQKELQAVSARLKLESDIRRIADDDMDKKLKNLTRITDKVRAGKDVLLVGKDLYNIIGEIYNATPNGQKKPLTLIGRGGGQNKDKR